MAIIRLISVLKWKLNDNELVNDKNIPKFESATSVFDLAATPKPA